MEWLWDEKKSNKWNAGASISTHVSRPIHVHGDAVVQQNGLFELGRDAGFRTSLGLGQVAGAESGERAGQGELIGPRKAAVLEVPRVPETDNSANNEDDGLEKWQSSPSLSISLMTFLKNS